jgi:7-cyano-7-deazaguanine synthase
MTTVVIYSGGLDSTVLLYELQAAGDELLALSIDYGQRHRRELKHAERIAASRGIEWRLADLSGIAPLLAGSSQTSPEIAVPHGHYAEESMKQTVVPNRNMIMLAVAAGWAISRKADRVAYAAHSGDHTIYPDCRPEFIAAMQTALGLADWHHVDLFTPFVGRTKAQIVARGAELGVDFAATWSCYEGGEQHCGRCGTCFERREAFQRAGVSDPTLYMA